MRYREKLNIIIMRDNGPRHSYHLQRSNFFLLLLFFSCLPFLCLLLAIQCYLLWQENVTLSSSMERFETDYQAAESRAERLERLEALLREENVPGREIVLKQIAQSSVPEPEPEKPAQDANQETAPQTEGPGHEDFPVLDTGRVKVSNVQARALRGNALRLSLDLRNPDNAPLLSGEVQAVLLTANGERRQLVFSPMEVGNFRINRFKRTVMMAQAPRNTTLANSQVILEVRDQEQNKPIFRNIFAVQH